jgi:hypothetical protein
VTPAVKPLLCDVVTREDFGEPGRAGDEHFAAFACQYGPEMLFIGEDGLPFVITRRGKPSVMTPAVPLSTAELRYILVLMGEDGPSLIRPGTFTACDVLALRDRLKGLLKGQPSGS